MPWWVAALLAAACWGMQYMLMEHFFERVGFAAPYTFITLATALVITAIMFTVYPRQDWSFLWQNWTVAGLVTLYVVCGTGAYLLTALAIRDAGEATNPSLLEITYPLFIVIFTAIFLGKVHLDSRGFIGAVLIVVGCALVLWSQGSPKPEM